MIEVELPDGTILEFPDGMQPDQIKAVIQAQMTRQKADSQVRDGGATDYTGGYGGEGFSQFTNLVMDPFGVRDEMIGAGAFARKFVTSGGSLDEASQEYSDTAERVRAEQRAARDDYGILPEIGGGFGTSGIGRAVAAAPTYLQGAWQSAKAGAGYGGAAGVGHAEGGVGERVAGGAKGAALGAALGPAFSHVALPAAARFVGGVRDTARYGSQVARSFANPEQHAVNTVADRGVRTGLDFGDVRARISPQPSPQLRGRNFTPADMAEIISRSARGDSAAQIAADYGIRADTVRRYVNLYHADNPTPLNMIDIAKEVAGEGGSGPITRLGRAAHSLAGDESGEAAQRLMSRQEAQPGRVSNIVQRSVAGGDFEATRAAGLRNLQDEAATAYRQFYREPDLAIDQLGDLMQDPLFRRANLMAQRQARVEAIRRNQDAARRGAPQEPIPEVDPDNQVFSPEMLDLIQRQLRIASEGFASNPNNARHAQNLRQVFLDRIEQHYPTFRQIRRDYATGQGEFGAEGALEAGAELTTRLGAPAREALRGFAEMTPAQQELFRLGFGRRLMDMAANPQIGSAVANKFNNTAVREIVKQLYPQSNPALFRQGQRLIRDLQREALTTRTKNDVLSGARTAELEGDMGRMMEGAQAAADVATGRWGAMLQNLSSRLKTQMGQRNATRVLDILTETDPARLLPLLNRLEQAAQSTQNRQALVARARNLRASNLPAAGGQTGLYTGREAAR